MINPKHYLPCMILVLTLCGIGHSQAHQGLDAHALPLGDGKVSEVPMRGYVYSCMQRFRGGGAQHVGDWIHG